MIQEQLKSRIAADKILAWIKTHQIAPGTRMKSIRTLAGEFSVSTQTITDALNILEKDSWIERKNRSGIFIRRPENKFEIGFFMDMRDERPEEFQRHLLRLMEPPYRDPEFNFTLRSLNLLGRQYNQDVLKNELELFVSRNCLSCILIVAPHMTKKDVDVCLALPVPVIFLGDFITPDEITPGYNQVTCDNYEAARSAFTQIFQKTGKKQAVLFIGSERTPSFYSEFADGARDVAAEYDAELHVVPVFPEDPARHSEDWKKEYVKKALEYIPSHGLDDALLFDALGMRFFELAEQIRCPFLERFYYSRQTPESMAVLFRRTNQLIRNVVANRDYRKALICPFESEIYHYKTDKNKI